MSVALSPDGTAYVAADETQAWCDGDPGGVVFLPLAGSATEKQRVLGRDGKYVPVWDLAMDSRGEPHIWFTMDAPDGLAHATRTPSGTWDVVPASRPGGGEWTRFALAPDDAPLVFGFVPADPSAWQLTVLDGTTERSLGAPTSPLEYDPIAPPKPAGQATIPRFAAVVQHPDGLRLASAAEGDGFDETAIPGTAMPTYGCDLGFGGPAQDGCPAACHEVTSGLEGAAFSAARTSDGDVWIAFAISHIDWTVAYEVQDVDVTATCVGNIAADASRGELRLVRVPAAGGAPEVALDLPLPAIAGDSHSADSQWERPLVHVSAFGAEITVAVRTRASRSGPYTVRALRIDTSLVDLAAPGD
ncbi:hypothetical protein BE11_05180 [Sorangium cellulosum]|nr:hypothetical protein BE11_05180 [Sorangium cellulosum]